MPEVGVGEVPIRPDLKGFGRDLDRGISPQIDGASRGITSKFKGIFTSVAALGGGILAGAAIGGFLKGAVAEAQEAAKIGRLTEAVVKSTGGAANVSAEQLGKLSERLSNIAAVDDEVIQSAGNVLLTFTKVRNEVGKGNNIFDRTSEAALNMSAALGTDLQGSMMQLGKAINDPIKGMTALSRAGVSFTQQQKDQVKAMVEAGDTLGAQKLILAEMETQFGGAAAAAADPMARLGVIVGNLQEQVGGALLPVIEKASVWLGENLPRAVSFLGDVFTRIAGPVREFWYSLTTGFTQDEGTSLEMFALRVRDALTALASFITDTAWPAIQRIAEAVGGWGNALTIVGVVIAAFVAPLATLAAGVVYAYTQFEWFRDVVDTVTSWFQGTAIPAVVDATGVAVATFQELRAYVDRIWPSIQEAIGHAMRAIREVIGVVTDAISAVWRAWGDDLMTLARTAFELIRETIDNVLQIIRGVISTVLALINGDWGQAWNGLKQILAGVWDQITNIIDTALAAVSAVIGGALSMVREVWSGAWDAMKGTASGAVDAVVGFFTGMPGRIGSALGGLAERITAPYRAAFSAIARLWNRTVGSISFTVPDWVPGIGGSGWNVPNIPEFHVGGRVKADLPRLFGDDFDERTVRLQVGETVLPRSGGEGSEVVYPDPEKWGRAAARAISAQLLLQYRSA